MSHGQSIRTFDPRWRQERLLRVIRGVRRLNRDLQALDAPLRLAVTILTPAQEGEPDALCIGVVDLRVEELPPQLTPRPHPRRGEYGRGPRATGWWERRPTAAEETHHEQSQ